MKQSNYLDQMSSFRALISATDRFCFVNLVKARILAIVSLTNPHPQHRAGLHSISSLELDFRLANSAHERSAATPCLVPQVLAT